LDGKALAARINKTLSEEISLLRSGRKRSPKLVSVQAGNDPASEAYLVSQRKSAESLGIEYIAERLDIDISRDKLIDVIEKFNKDRTVSGIIVQMPLPAHVDAKSIPGYISPLKDVEALNPRNMGEMVFGKARMFPCTAAACMELLNSIGPLDLYGKEAVIVGHSEIVGKPLALMLLNKFVTVTVCHIATSERGSLSEFVKRAEILIVACGKACLIKGEWIRKDAIVIDVGINRVDGKIVGDVDFEAACEKASYITPVPGGVGPLTTAMLMRNVVEAFKSQI
jgi:methylenetetrahydrofolate dehydrogenase (NADP+)/methenyltetrahydrofolate cyclohydrolase